MNQWFDLSLTHDTAFTSLAHGNRARIGRMDGDGRHRVYETDLLRIHPFRPDEAAPAAWASGFRDRPASGGGYIAVQAWPWAACG